MPTDSDVFLMDLPATFLAKVRKRLFWVGAIMIVLGIAAIMMPLFSSLVIETLIGWLLVISGALALVSVVSLRGTGLFIWELTAGLLTLAAGLLLLLFPLEGLIALTVLIALVMVWTGLGQGAFALWVRPAPGWVWGLLSAIISLGLAAYILVALPEASAIVLGLLVGIDFVSTGTALVLIAWSVYRGTQG